MQWFWFVLDHPLTLIGGVSLLLFGSFYALLCSKAIRPATRKASAKLLQNILWYGFVIALCVTLLGFGLAAKKIEYAIGLLIFMIAFRFGLAAWKAHIARIRSIDARRLAEKLFTELNTKNQYLQNKDEQIRALTETIIALHHAPVPEKSINEALYALEQQDTIKAKAIFAEILAKKIAEGEESQKDAAAAARDLGTLAFLTDTNEALIALRQAVELDPNDPDGYIKLGTALFFIGKYSEAEDAFHKILALGEYFQNNVWRVEAYKFLGNLYQIQGNLNKAENAFRKILALGKSFQNNVWCADACRSLGCFCDNLNNAEQMFQQALMFDKECNNKEGIANDYIQLSGLYQKYNNPDKAEQMLQHALDVYEELNYTPNMSVFDAEKGDGLDNINKELHKAEEWHQSHFSKVGLKLKGELFLGFSSILKAFQHITKLDYVKAEQKIQQGLSIFNRFEHIPFMTAPIAFLYALLGMIYSKRGEHAKAEQMGQESLKLLQKAEFKPPKVVVYNLLGGVYFNTGHLDKAEQMYQQSLTLNQELGNKEGIAINYSNLGDIYYKRGDLAQAEQMYQQVLTLCKELDNKKGMAAQYHNLGLIYETRGDLVQAEQMYQQSLTLHKKLDSKEGIAINYGNLGSLYSKRGDLVQAEQMYQQSLTLYKELGNKEQMVWQYNKLGILYETRGDLAQAEQMCQQSLTLCKELDCKEGIAINYGNLGLLYSKRGDIALAAQMYQQSLTLYKELDNKEQMAWQYNKLGILYEMRGDLVQAEHMYQQSLTLYKELDNKKGMADQYNNLGLLYKTRGDLRQAEQMGRKSLQLLHEIKHPTATGVQQWLNELKY